MSVKRKFALFFLCVCTIIIMFLNGCARESSNSGFSKVVGTEIQSYLNITTFYASKIKPNTDITLVIANKTSDCVVFPYNFGEKTYIYRNDGWMEIPDNVTYASHKDVVLDPKGEEYADAVVTISPDYSKIGKITNKQRIRIVLIGKLCKNGLPTNQLTADYIELNVEP
jgi:hypothetical protein